MKSKLVKESIDHKIIFDGNDFLNLIQGNVVKKGNIEIILEDIGFTNMIKLVRQAWEMAER